MRTEPRRVLVAALAILGLAAATALAQDAIITGTDGNDLLTGTAADEAIYGRAGNDVINGGGGNDELDGGPGADVLNGGTGSDVVSYSGATGVRIRLDGKNNDGAPGEHDNIGNDVEDLFGTDGRDDILGSSKNNTIDGGAGDDKLNGGSGNDAIFGGSGDDEIRARDRRLDRIDCGSGRDTATVDRNDVTTGCERVLRTPITDRFDVTLRPRQRRLIVGSIDPISTIVIACRRGCHPRRSTKKALIRVRNVRGPTKRIKLPNRVTGALLEIGVTRKGALTRCRRVSIGSGFGSFRKSSRKCTTVAKG